MKSLTYDLPVYTYDIDAMQHVSNVVYIRWMEIGRIELLRAVGFPVETIMERGFGPILVETEIRYRKPCFLGDQVQGEVWISELTHLTAWLSFRFTKVEGAVVAEGRQRGAFIDLKSGKPRKLTSEERDRFAEYLHSVANK